jgi:hypothetical protein
MLYTNYFSSLIKEQGPPNLNPDQFRRMMNIVFVEGIIVGMQRIKEKEKTMVFRYDMLIFKHQKVLTDLTGNLQPRELVREMYSISQN